MPIKREVTIGDCRLLLGDCLEILPTLEKVDAAVTDPPYGAQTRDNARTHRNQGFNDASKSQYIEFSITENHVRQIFDLIGGMVNRWTIASMEFRHAADFERNPPNGLRFVRIGAWVKNNSAPQFTGDRPAQGWEAVAIMHSLQGKLSWNGGGSRAVWITDVERNNGHPTPKPLHLVQDWISLFSNSGDTILDPFMGSGTTGVACAKLGRKFIGIEIDGGYFDIACRRIEESYKQPDLFIAPPAPKMEQGVML